MFTTNYHDILCVPLSDTSPDEIQIQQPTNNNCKNKKIAPVIIIAIIIIARITITGTTIRILVTQIITVIIRREMLRIVLSKSERIIGKLL